MLCVLVPICFLMAGTSVVLTTYAYRANKKDLDVFFSSDFSKVFSTKLCNNNFVNCDVSNFKNHCSFETLVDNNIFINGG